MRQSYTFLPDDDMDHLFLHAPEVISMVRANGCVLDTQLDTLGITKLPGDLHINRDSLVTWRQHAHVLSHTDSRLKFANYLQMRVERDDPLLQLQRKQLDQAAKVVQRAAKLKEKEDLLEKEKAAKNAEKTAEKQRRLALTVTQRKMEDTERKAKNALSKAAKESATAANLVNALELLADAEEI